MSEPQSEKVKAILQDCGREMADVWIRKAIDAAKNDLQMNNQLQALKYAAINILAHHGLNHHVQNGLDYADFVHEISTEIMSELCQMEEGGTTEWVEPGGKDGGA